MYRNVVLLLVLLLLAACQFQPVPEVQATPTPGMLRVSDPPLDVLATATVALGHMEAALATIEAEIKPTRRATRTASTLAATDTPLPTDTPESTATATERPTRVPTATEEPTATPPPDATATPQPDTHDVTTCHGAETGDGHTHGHCWTDLPPGPIRSYVEANPVYGQVGHPWHSSPTENVYPWPMGAHEGHKFLFEAYDTCHQFTNVPDAPTGSCVWAAYFAPHSTGIAEEIYKPPLSVHSEKFVLQTCENPSPDQDCIVAGGALAQYGEVHNEYKMDFCIGLLPGLIEYPAGHHLNQPPYVAVNKTRDGIPHRFFWSSLTNGLMGGVFETLGYPRPNNLWQAAWIESTWEGPNPDPALCGNPLYDVIACAASNDGCENSRFWLFTFKVDIDEYPRPFDGFVDRLGNPAAGCAEPAHDCIPLHIGADVPAGDVFFNRPVQPKDTPFLDYAEPGLYMPGSAP